MVQKGSVQLFIRVWLFATPLIAARQASLFITSSWSLLKFMSIELWVPSNHLILCHPLLLPPSIFPSIRVFSNEPTLPIRWPKYWSFSFNISLSNECSGLISFRMDWLDLLAVQGTLKSLLQQHSSKASILQHSAFFTVQLSHPYMTTGKTIALTKWTWEGNRQEGQGSPNGGKRLQVPDIFLSLKWQEETTSDMSFLLYTNLKGFSQHAVWPWYLVSPEANYSQTLS